MLVKYFRFFLFPSQGVFSFERKTGGNENIGFFGESEEGGGEGATHLTGR